MVKTKDRLYDTADTMRPYVDRALHDDALHDNIKEAFTAARDVYAELLGNRNLTGTAMRAATSPVLFRSAMARSAARSRSTTAGMPARPA